MTPLKLRTFPARMVLDHARHVLDSRRVIPMGIGLLMGEYQLTEEAAREVIRRRARQAGVDVHQVAAQIVDEAETSGLALPAAPDC